jgi:hypothetical protein
MDRITEKGVGTRADEPRQQNLDLHIEECSHCAHTCRTWAEAYLDRPEKIATIIDACLDCARTCEATARALLLHKQGVRNIRQLQIEACVIACKACARQCMEKASSFDGLSVCATTALRCEEILRTLLSTKAPQVNGTKFFTFLRVFAGR